MAVFDTRVCALGEGALWHPKREELFWFDITGKRLLARSSKRDEVQEISLPEMCSAAAWIDNAHLLVASESALSVVNLATESFSPLVGLEAGNSLTRSNDGRADPWGGFWIGTMGKQAQPGAGAIYRFAAGELRKLFPDMTIPNAICFAPDRSAAYFADTAIGKLFRVALDSEGWPKGAAEVFVDFAELDLNPDGAVALLDGSLRVALWGAGQVVSVSKTGQISSSIDFPAPHVTCPAFGDEGFTTLFCTSATEGLGHGDLMNAPLSGCTFGVENAGVGMPEPAFDLGAVLELQGGKI